MPILFSHTVFVAHNCKSLFKAHFFLKSQLLSGIPTSLILANLFQESGQSPAYHMVQVS